MTMTLALPRPRRDLVDLMRAEFDEMPGLTLTLAQASRLWASDVDDCESALELLTASGFLRVVGQSYVRAFAGRRCA